MNSHFKPKKLLNFPDFFVKEYEMSPKDTLKPCHSMPYFTIVLLSIVVWRPKLPMTKIILIVNGKGDWMLFWLPENVGWLNGASFGHPQQYFRKPDMGFDLGWLDVMLGNINNQMHTCNNPIMHMLNDNLTFIGEGTKKTFIQKNVDLI